MASIGRFHGHYVHPRRVEILAEHISRVLPADCRVLDVGCGDGRLAKVTAGKRSDVEFEGVDVLVRRQTEIPVREFDGHRLPYDDGDFDAVMMVDVLHHTDDPHILLQEAARVASRAIVLKDHLREGLLAGPTLRFMDWVGNARHDVALPYNYWRRKQWIAAFDRLGLEIADWRDRLDLYPLLADWLFGRSLHFVALVTPPSSDVGESSPENAAARR